MVEQASHPPDRGESLPALWCASYPAGESAALVRFFTPDEGSLLAKAPGLSKAGSKLAPLLQYGDELRISLATGRSRTPTLTGVSLASPHSAWRRALRPLALLWFMLESAVLTSGSPHTNAATYRLLVNLLRSEPADADLEAALCVYCLKLLALQGLAPDLLNCAETGAPFSDAEPVFLLPSGEGLLCRDVYNQRYARSSAVLARLDAQRRKRWLALLHGPLLRYAARGCDGEDAALLLKVTAGQVGSLANQDLASARNLAQAWRLPAR